MDRRKAHITLELTPFMPPPAGEALVIGKNCPYGPDGAKRMLELVAPGDFEFIRVDNPVIEAVLVRSFLFKRMDRDQLVQAIVEEAEPVMCDACALSVKCGVTISVQRRIDIS